jgi:mRNA interferase YafQ
VSAKLGLPTSRPAFCFLASLVLAQPKTKPNFFTSPKELKKVAQKLAHGEKLESKYKDHSLKGSFKKDHRECHIKPDWLLIYRIEENELVFVRTGTHSDLFK